jgi:Ca2+-dependent lipid-binding protein
METKFILIHSLKENMVFNLLDFNDHRKDTALGSVTYSLSKLLEDQTHEDIVSPILQDGKDNGELRYDVNYFPVIEAEEGKEEVLDSSMSSYQCGWRSEPHDPFFVKLSVLCVL